MDYHKKNALVTLQRFFLKCNNIYQNLPEIKYNKININYYSINKFYTSEKKNNDSFNKFRESIIGAIINNLIPYDYFKYSNRWNKLKKEIDIFMNQLTDNTIESVKCIHRGGRMYHYDFTILINGEINFNIEFKFNVSNISDSPQYVSPMKPSNYLTNSYEEFYYDNYLPNLTKHFNIEIPNREIYLKEVHSPNPYIVSELQNKYYGGCKSSSKYTGNENDISFYNFARKNSKDSIMHFIETTDLKLDKLSSYLKKSQEGKYYMLYKNGTFELQKKSLDDYELVSYVKNPERAKYIAKNKNGKYVNILLRWKNGNGIAYPAFQIS